MLVSRMTPAIGGADSSVVINVKSCVWPLSQLDVNTRLVPKVTSLPAVPQLPPDPHPATAPAMDQPTGKTTISRPAANTNSRRDLLLRSSVARYAQLPTTGLLHRQ